MKFMHPENRLIRFALVFLFVSVLVPTTFAQTKKKPAATPTAKKTADVKKDAKKTPQKSATKSTAKQTSAEKKAAANKKEVQRPTLAQRRAEAERKKKEEARRAAALAEQRRREQAAREARARKIAFENGLRSETAANIAKDVTTGEDLKVRGVAVNALGNRAGTVVVMEAKTGRVVTMVNQEWAIKEGFKPCSTIKLVTGVAGISENLIDPDGNITGESSRLDLSDALAHSNNPYFQRVGVKMGTETMIDYAKQLGLGQKTGINADGETTGRLPIGNRNPRIYSHADDFEVTPLQLAVMVTAISNGGKRIVPQFRRERTESAGFKPIYRKDSFDRDRELRGVIPGMIGAAEYGTARRGMDQSLGVAGKTGSCIGRGSWVGLFASVAPIEDPKYAVVVITRGDSERGRIAANIASQIYKALAPQIERDRVKYLALKQNNNPPRMESALASADTDDEDDDSEATEAETVVEQKRVITTASQRPVNAPQPAAKPVVRTTQAKPAFPPVIINYDKAAATKPAAAAAKPTAKPASRLVSKPAAKSTTTPKPATKATSKPAAKPNAKSNSKPSSKPEVKTPPAKKPTQTRPRVVKN